MSETGLESANKLIPEGHFEVASVYDNLAQPFSVMSFDGIACIEVIEYLSSPASFAKRGFEALRL